MCNVSPKSHIQVILLIQQPKYLVIRLMCSKEDPKITIMAVSFHPINLFKKKEVSRPE
jgi:hypothetical protein